MFVCLCVCVFVCLCVCVFVCLCVCLSVSSLPLVRSVQLLRNAEKRIANITKAYIRNNLQVE